MLKIKVFTFNPFYENTYVLYDDNKECVIMDPGCSNRREEKELDDFITSEGLKPVRLLNTHCHIDHILGNRFVSEKYDLPLEANPLEEANIRSADIYAEQFGLPAPQSPMFSKELKEGEEVTFGNIRLHILFAPGHSAGHVVFYNEESSELIGGDVLFYGSIGRTDLPGGDHATLIRSIKEKLFVLPDSVTVYPGHGPATTIGYEKKHNPFLT